MFDNTTIVAVGAASTSLLMAVIPPSDPMAAWTQLGVAGASMGILFWIVSRRDPKVAEINAEAIKAAAETHAKALQDLVQAQKEDNQRHHELVMKALHAQPPK